MRRKPKIPRLDIVIEKWTGDTEIVTISTAERARTIFAEIAGRIDVRKATLWEVLHDKPHLLASWQSSTPEPIPGP